jgi:hypothetical protein
MLVLAVSWLHMSVPVMFVIPASENAPLESSSSQSSMETASAIIVSQSAKRVRACDALVMLYVLRPFSGVHSWAVVTGLTIRDAAQSGAT